MNCPLPRLVLTALATGLLLSGCGGRGATRNANHAADRGSAASAWSEHGATRLPEATGIPACDDYLASYKSCHLAAHIYPPAQLEAHYQAMRTSLLRDSLDPAIRPQLAARCSALATQLREVLHDQPCDAPPAMPGGDGRH